MTTCRLGLRQPVKLRQLEDTHMMENIIFNKLFIEVIM